MIHVGDNAAETHAYFRARKIGKSDGTTWEHDELENEIEQEAADGVCPECAALQGGRNV
jgi:hypothetical protein